MAGIPISTIVKVAPGVLAAGGSLNALTGLVLSTNAAVVPVGTVKDFTTAADVGAAFGMESVEYQMACVYFAGYTNAALTPARLLFGGYAMAFFCMVFCCCSRLGGGGTMSGIRGECPVAGTDQPPAGTGDNPAV